MKGPKIHITPIFEMKRELVLLEYEESSGCFHYNTVYDGKLDYPVCTNAYQPVTVMPRNIAQNRGFSAVIADAMRERYPYAVVVEKVALWALNNAEEWMK